MSLHDVGETTFVTIWTTNDAGTLVDADSLPAATLAAPDGTTATLTPTHPATGTYTIAAPLTLAGDYTLRTVATVGGNPRVDVRRLAALDPATTPAASLPAWAPSLAEVADHIPGRTRPTAEWPATDALAGTFTDATTPTRTQAGRLISRACAWVATRLGPVINSRVYRLAGEAAALRAAYWVEVAYPERDADLTVYDRLRAEAEAALDLASSSNVEIGGDDPTPGGLDDLSSFAFPARPPWADLSFL